MLGVTSGTTGEPKAAMLSHMNFISGQVAGGWLGFDFSENDVYLSYAPLTHVQEQIIHLNAVLYSFKIGYSSGDMKMLVSDIQALRPTVFGSFPAFYNKIYSKIRDKVEGMPSMVQTVIDQAIQ